MDLLGVLLGSMTTDEASSALAGKTGASAEQSSKLAASALPVMMKALTGNASASKEGAESLLHALDQHKVEKTMKEQIDEADTEDGAKIVRHILGDKEKDVIQELKATTDMSEEQVTKGLASMAPALLSLLAAAMKGSSGGNSFNPMSLLGMFGGSEQSAASGLNLMSSLLGGGSKPASSGIGGLVGSLLGGGSKPAGSGIGGMLGSLFGGGSQQSSSDTDGSDLLGALTSLLK